MKILKNSLKNLFFLILAIFINLNSKGNDRKVKRQRCRSNHKNIKLSDLPLEIKENIIKEGIKSIIKESEISKVLINIRKFLTSILSINRDFASFNQGKSKIKFINMIKNIIIENIDLSNINSFEVENQILQIINNIFSEENETICSKLIIYYYIYNLNLNNSLEIDLKDYFSFIKYTNNIKLKNILKSLISLRVKLILPDNIIYMLQAAIREKNIKLVKFILYIFKHTNLERLKKSSILADACNTNNIYLVKMIIDLKLNLDYQDNNGYTALIWAANSGYKDILQLLIDNNANLDIQNNNGNTALICAVFKNHLDSVRILINAGANINLQNIRKKTALGIAIENKNDKLIVCLNSINFFRNNIKGYRTCYSRI